MGRARKAAFSFVTPCVRTEQRDFHWTDFQVRVISCLEFSRNSSIRPDFGLNLTTDILLEDERTFLSRRWSF